jgi:hypothetical protein
MTENQYKKLVQQIYPRAQFGYICNTVALFLNGPESECKDIVIFHGYLRWKESYKQAWAFVQYRVKEELES